MLNLALALIVASSAGSSAATVDRLVGEAFGGGTATRVVTGLVDKVLTVQVTSDEPDPADSDPSDTDSDTGDEAAPLPQPAPVPPLPPVPPAAPGERELPRFTEKGKNVPTVEVLHRIAQTAGWSMTVVGSPRDQVDIDVKNVDPRDALRTVLKQSGAMGVLKNDKLVVIGSPGGGAAGMLIEKTGSHKTVTVHGQRTGRARNRGNDMVRVFQGDLTVPGGQVVQGDVVCVGGSVELEPGSVVQGDAVAVGGSVSVDKGALVMGQAVAVLGTVDVERGAQVMGEHVQVGIGKLFGSSHHKSGWLTGLGLFGLFPTIALFALTYLVGLLLLRLWPERMRNVGHAMFENPVRSFTVGFLCWLLLLPLLVLLAISLVGIPLIPLLPLALFISIVMGMSSFAMRIGEALPAGPGQRFVPPAALGMGMTVLLLLAFVPWLGTSLLFLLQFFALGASVSSRFGRALPPHVA